MKPYKKKTLPLRMKLSVIVMIIVYSVMTRMY